MSTSIAEVVAYLRGSIPQPDALCEIQQPVSANGVTFVWFATRFYANTAFEVFELRGQKLYISPASLLLQTLLRAAKHQRETLYGALLQLRNAEQALIHGRQIHTAAKAIQLTREGLERETRASATSDTPAKGESLGRAA